MAYALGPQTDAEYTHAVEPIGEEGGKVQEDRALVR